MEAGDIGPCVGCGDPPRMLRCTFGDPLLTRGCAVVARNTTWRKLLPVIDSLLRFQRTSEPSLDRPEVEKLERRERPTSVLLSALRGRRTEKAKHFVRNSISATLLCFFSGNGVFLMPP